MPNVEKLEVYHLSHALTLDVYEATRGFPREELFGLTSQMRRSASSVPMNLAEGSGRGGDLEYRRFVGIAHGSLFELRYQVQLARDLGLIDDAAHLRLAAQIATIGRMLYGLRRRLGGSGDQ